MKRKNNKGITLISLIVTIVVLIILASVTITLIVGENNLLIGNAKEGANETRKQMASEKINLKITNSQINTYAEEQRMPTLQELADDFCEDEEIEYVELKSKKIASLEKIEVDENGSFFTKLKEYPYEFEINSSLQLASIDGIQIATNTSGKTETIKQDEETGFYYYISDKFCILWQNYTASNSTSTATLIFPFEFAVTPSCQITKTTRSNSNNNIVLTNIDTNKVTIDTNYGTSNKCSFSIMVCGILK